MTKLLTKKQLEIENHELRKKNLELLGQYRKSLDRKKLAGLYLQVLRLLPEYTDNKHGVFPTVNDYDRLLGVLEVDEYPEGF